MPLIKCPNCGQMVSDRSDHCIYCGKVLDNDVHYVLNTELRKAHAAVMQYKQHESFQNIDDKILEYALIGNTARAALLGQEGTKKSYERAFILFEYLFNTYQQPDIAYYLGFMYEQGLYVNQDYNEAYKFYMIAAKNANKVEGLPYSDNQESAKAKFNLGKMIVNYHNKIRIPGIDDAYYGWAIGLYLCAADDGLQEAYGWLKILGTINVSDECADDSSDMNPIPILDRAQNGDTDAMFELVNLYLSQLYMPEFRFDYAIKWAKTGYEAGSKECWKMNIVLSLAKDVAEYNLDSENYEVVRQEGGVYELFALLCGRDKQYNPCDEILVVHSRENVENALNMFVEFCSKYQDEDDIEWVRYQYIDFINAANSFSRPKMGLPGYRN